MVPISDMRGASSATARSCILFVEDELLIRIIVSEELREAGYDVIEACDGDEALTILRAFVKVDLVISDVRMPGSVDGLGLLAEVKESHPALPVILTSGHLDPRLALADGATQFLQKPYALDALIEAVRRDLVRTA